MSKKSMPTLKSAGGAPGNVVGYVNGRPKLFIDKFLRLNRDQNVQYVHVSSDQDPKTVLQLVMRLSTAPDSICVCPIDASASTYALVKLSAQCAEELRQLVSRLKGKISEESTPAEITSALRSDVHQPLIFEIVNVYEVSQGIEASPTVVEKMTSIQYLSDPTQSKTYHDLLSDDIGASKVMVAEQPLLRYKKAPRNWQGAEGYVLYAYPTILRADFFEGYNPGRPPFNVMGRRFTDAIVVSEFTQSTLEANVLDFSVSKPYSGAIHKFSQRVCPVGAGTFIFHSIMSSAAAQMFLKPAFPAAVSPTREFTEVSNPSVNCDECLRSLAYYQWNAKTNSFTTFYSAIFDPYQKIGDTISGADIFFRNFGSDAFQTFGDDTSRSRINHAHMYAVSSLYLTQCQSVCDHLQSSFTSTQTVFASLVALVQYQLTVGQKLLDFATRSNPIGQKLRQWKQKRVLETKRLGMRKEEKESLDTDIEFVDTLQSPEFQYLMRFSLAHNRILQLIVIQNYVRNHGRFPSAIVKAEVINQWKTVNFQFVSEWQETLTIFQKIAEFADNPIPGVGRR